MTKTIDLFVIFSLQLYVKLITPRAWGQTPLLYRSQNSGRQAGACPLHINQENKITIQAFDYRNKICYSSEKAYKFFLTERAHAHTTLRCLKPGQHIHPHVHAGDYVWVALEGEGLFLTDGLKTCRSAGETSSPRPSALPTVLTTPAALAWFLPVFQWVRRSKTGTILWQRAGATDSY
jgi:mannose-6-phosphate isomerase-like protein (cupin superfamily)